MNVSFARLDSVTLSGLTLTVVTDDIEILVNIVRRTERAFPKHVSLDLHLRRGFFVAVVYIKTLGTMWMPCVAPQMVSIVGICALELPFRIPKDVFMRVAPLVSENERS